MKDIEKYLNTAKSKQNEAFPFSDKEIRSFLDNADQAQSINKRNGAIKMGIISSLVIVAVSLAINFSDTTPEQKPQTANTHEITASSANTSKAENALPVLKNEKSNNKMQLNSNTVETKRSTFVEKTIDAESVDATQKTKTTEPQIDLAQATTTPEKIQNEKTTQPSTTPAKTELIINMTDSTTDIEDIDTVNVLKLTPEELERINIYKTFCGYAFLAEDAFPLGRSADDMKKINALGYPKNGILRQMSLVSSNELYSRPPLFLKYEGWNHEQSQGVFPLEGNFRFEHKENQSSSYLTSGFGYQVVEASHEFYNNDISDNLPRELSKNLSDYSTLKTVKVLYDKDKFPTIKGNIFVWLDLQNDTMKSMCVLIYPATSNMIALLPERYKIEPQDDMFDGIGEKLDAEFLHTQSSNAVRDNDLCTILTEKSRRKKPVFNSDGANISSVEKIELTDEEARKIGLVIDDEKINTQFEDYIDKTMMPKKALDYIHDSFDYDVSPENILLKSDISIIKREPSNNYGLKVKPVSYTNWDYSKWSALAPVCITQQVVRISSDGKTMHSLNLSQVAQSPLLKNENRVYLNSEDIVDRDSSDKYRAVISGVVPVEFTWSYIKDDGDTIRSTAQLWYVLSQEFVDRLPDRYRGTINTELQLMQLVNQGVMSADQACDVLKGDVSYTGLCSMSSETIKSIAVHPNPTPSDNINLEIKIAKECKAKVDLYSMDGEYINTLVDNIELKEGLFKTKVSTDEVSEGIYLLVASDEKGNQVVQKLIISNK